MVCGRRLGLVHFNPRSRTGSDKDLSFVGVRASISTHAPAQGATQVLHHHFFRSQHFNPRSRTGSDGKIKAKSQKFEQFQPTLPHRERPRRDNPPVKKA